MEKIYKVFHLVLEELKDEISKIDINSLTPVEALLKLSELKKKIDN